MSSIAISSRSESTPDSPIRRIAPFADAAKARGVHVYHLNIGDPDIEAPPEFLEGVRNYKNKLVSYEPARGNLSLREQWSEYYNQSCHIKTSSENFIITNGASEALQYAMIIAADPGDEILVLDPVYANYVSIATMAGIILKPVMTRLEEGFVPPDASSIATAITPRTKAVLLCNPNNPSGAVLSEAFLTQVHKICEERNLLLIVDETYREMVFDGLTPISILKLAPTSERVMVIDSFSKRFSLCGARIGCFVSYNLDLVHAAYRMASSRLAISSVDQAGALNVIQRVGSEFVTAMTKEFESRRNVLCEALEKIPGVVIGRPKGAFYMMVRLPVKSSEEFVLFLLKDFQHQGATVFLTPAKGFYVTPGCGEDQVRIAYVLKSQDLIKATEIIRLGLEAFSSS